MQSFAAVRVRRGPAVHPIRFRSEGMRAACVRFFRQLREGHADARSLCGEVLCPAGGLGAIRFQNIGAKGRRAVRSQEAGAKGRVGAAVCGGGKRETHAFPLARGSERSFAPVRRLGAVRSQDLCGNVAAGRGVGQMRRGCPNRSDSLSRSLARALSGSPPRGWSRWS